jgi:hypothetical protein
MPSRLQTIVETHSYLRFGERHLNDQERLAVVELLAKAPEPGVLIQGSGGVRNYGCRRKAVEKAAGRG